MAYIQSQQQQPTNEGGGVSGGPGQAGVMSIAYANMQDIDQMDTKHHNIVQAIEVNQPTLDHQQQQQQANNQQRRGQQQQQQQPQQHIIEVEAPGGLSQNNQSSSSSATIILDDTQQQQRVGDDTANTSSRPSLVDGPNVKTPNSYKYPLLKRYYEFGQWIGRNRKAVCLGCNLQTSSSQPDRLLKHLNRCTALSDADKVAVQDLMNERTANKRKKPSSLALKLRKDNDDNSTEYYADDANTSSNNDQSNTISIPAGGLKKLRRDHPDKASQIDEALTRFIMVCRIPLKAIHSQEFVDFCRSLNPDYRIPSRETITNVLIPGMLNII